MEDGLACPHAMGSYTIDSANGVKDMSGVVAVHNYIILLYYFISFTPFAESMV